MLANLNLLFWLSLVPFVTGWVGESHFASIPVAIYAGLLNVCGISYSILQKTIEACHKNDPHLVAVLKAQHWKIRFTVFLYGIALPLAFVSAYISIALFFIVSVMWLVPDKKIEKAVSGE